MLLCVMLLSLCLIALHGASWVIVNTGVVSVFAMVQAGLGKSRAGCHRPRTFEVSFVVHRRMEVDGYLSNRAPSSWVAALPSRLLLAPRDVAGAGTRYNTPLMNALVFYVGIQVRPYCLAKQTRCMSCVSFHVPMRNQRSLPYYVDCEHATVLMHADRSGPHCLVLLAFLVRGTCEYAVRESF